MSLTTYYVEMRALPARRPPNATLTVLRAAPPTLSFYRYLFDAVGGTWNWVARKRLTDEELRAIVTDGNVEIYVLYVNGAPAGFSELDRRIPREVEIKYFGLMPEFIGQGLGRAFLDWTLQAAWSGNPSRVWLHTCTEDHPQALEFYLQAGFELYDQVTDYDQANETSSSSKQLAGGAPL